MALTRAEVEVLIKARNEAQGAFDSLTSQIEKVTQKAAPAAEGLERTGDKAKGAGVGAQAAAVALGSLASVLASKLITGLRDTFDASSRVESAMVGLGATAKAFGVDATGAQNAAASLAKDGLMTVAEASAGLKNLLAAGFGLPEAIEIMNRFKDSAAFGRQGSLEFGQAIVGATEGIKNGNSALVDNAGLTKNLSNILVEAGFSAQDLSKATSDVNVRQALFKGILKETNPQLGQAAKYLETAAGKQALYNSAVETAKAKIGQGLQPALSALLSTLTPLAGFVGNNADTLIRLATVVASVVGPIVTVTAVTKAASTVFAFLTPAVQATSAALTANVGSAGAARAGLQALGVQAKLTLADIGLLGAAVAAAGAAFAGWQIGRLIADLTGADAAIDDYINHTKLTASVREEMVRGGERLAASERKLIDLRRELTQIEAQGYGSNSQQARMAEIQDQIKAIENDQRRLAILDTINKARAAGASAEINYADAVAYNQKIEAIRVGTFDKSAAAQRAMIAAQVDLGKISREAGNAALANIAAEEQAQKVAKNRIALTAVQAAGEKQFQAEIKASGYTLNELLAALKQNEGEFEKYAQQVGLSDETVKRLKKTLTEQTQEHTKAAAATKKHAEEEKQLHEKLEQIGILTLPQLNTKLAELAKFQDAAKASGVPLERILFALVPQYRELAEAARLSGVGVQQSTAALAEANRVLGPLVSMMDAAARTSVANQEILKTFAILPRVSSDLGMAHVKAAELTDAFKYFGLSTRTELQKTAELARFNFQNLVASGTASGDQIKVAFDKMVAAQKAVAGELPGYWQKEVVPKIVGTLEQLNTAINGTFAQMLLGAKGFKDGWIDIWDSLKAATLNVMNAILSAFISGFVKKMTASLAGESNIWGSIIQRGLTSSQGGGGVNWSSLAASAAGGTGSSAPLAAQGFVGYAGTAGSATQGVGASSATGGAGAGAAVAGGLAAAGGGYLVGNMLAAKFGKGNYFKSGGIGAASGAATGAAIGSVVPGIGTGVGAGIGAIAGAIGGWIAARKLNKQADKDMQAVKDRLIETLGGLENVRQQAALVGVDIDKAFAQKGVKGVKTFNDIVADFDKKWSALDDATKRYGITLDELQNKTPIPPVQAEAQQLEADLKALTGAGMQTDGALRKMAPAFNDMIAAALASGEKLPASLQPFLLRLNELGLLTDENARKLAGMTDGVTVDFQAMQDVASRYGIELGALGPKFQQSKLSEMAGQVFSDFEMLTKAGADVGGVLYGMREEVSNVVQESLRFGTEIPANMKPLVEELARSGLLLDENGNKIEDLGKIKFAEPISAGFDKIVQAIKDLGSALTGDLPNKAAEGGKAAREALEQAGKNVPPWVQPVVYEYPDGAPRPPWNEGGPYGPGGNQPEGAAAGGVLANRPGLVLFGEGGEAEMGGPVSFMQKALEGAIQRTGIGLGGGISLRVPVMLDRRQMGEAIYELTPQMLRQKGHL